MEKVSINSRIVNLGLGGRKSCTMEEIDVACAIADSITKETGKVYIGNSFSLQMIPADAIVAIEEVDEFPLYAHSVVGHQDLANILGVKYNRESITLETNDVLYVAQIIGGRLAEGTTELPKGFELKFLKVTLKTF